MVKKHIDPKELNALSIWSKTQQYNFGEKQQGDAWDLAFDLTEKEMEGDGFQPMMNYLYPIEEFENKKENLTDREIKKALDDAGAVTLIKKYDDDEYYLALTGGGMDLTWDICAGYVNLGYLPPFHFCEGLPDFAGENYGDVQHRNVILACQRSISLVEQRAKRAMTDLQKFIDKTYGSKWKWEPDR